MHERPAELPDAPVPPLVLLKRAMLAATWWPLFMLKNYSDTPLWLLQRRLLALDMRKAQRDAWSNVEKPQPPADADEKRTDAAKIHSKSVETESRQERRSSRSPRRRAAKS